MNNQQKKQTALLNKIREYSYFARGSITSVCQKCNRATCICKKKTSTKAYRLTYKDNKQKTRIVYISKHKLPEIRKMIKNYAKLRKIINQLNETNLKIFKT